MRIDPPGGVKEAPKSAEEEAEMERQVEVAKQRTLSMLANKRGQTGERHGNRTPQEPGAPVKSEASAHTESPVQVTLNALGELTSHE